MKKNKIIASIMIIFGVLLVVGFSIWIGFPPSSNFDRTPICVVGFVAGVIMVVYPATVWFLDAL